MVKLFSSIKFQNNTYYRELLFQSTNFGGAFFPERASHFELLKEFQAAQNTTCHLLSANTISLIDCIKIYRIEHLNESEKISFVIRSLRKLCVGQTETYCARLRQFEKGNDLMFLFALNIDYKLSCQQKLMIDQMIILIVSRLVSRSIIISNTFNLTYKST